jgi:hypothetical protein
MSKKKSFVGGNINKPLNFKFTFKIYGQKYIMCIRFLLQESGFYYVLTRSFSSDAVEATFSHVKLRGVCNDAMDARTAEYAMRQILRCGIVKASKFSNTTENINFVSSARIQNLIGRDGTNNFENLLSYHIGNTNSNSSIPSNYSPCRKHFFGISGFFSRIHLKKIK